jgi:hypothetical protein
MRRGIHDGHQGAARHPKVARLVEWAFTDSGPPSARSSRPCPPDGRDDGGLVAAAAHPQPALVLDAARAELLGKVEHHEGIASAVRLR